MTRHPLSSDPSGAAKAMKSTDFLQYMPPAATDASSGLLSFRAMVGTNKSERMGSTTAL